MGRFAACTQLKRVIHLVILLPFYCVAQELDSLASDSLTLDIDTVEIVPPTHYIGAYMVGGITLEPSRPNHNIISFVGGGFQYDRWSLGFLVYDFQGLYESFVIFPNVFNLKYRYGGPNVGYFFLMNRKLYASLNLSYLRGDMVWRNKEDGENFLRDEFNMIKANLRIELSRVRYLKPYISIGYQRINDLKLTGVKAENFSGIQYSIGLRVGYFNQ